MPVQDKVGNIWTAHFIEHKYEVPCAMWFCPRDATWFVFNQNRSHTFHLCAYHKEIWPNEEPK